MRVSDCNIRELRSDGLEMVLNWRNSDRIRSVMFNNNPISLEEHLAWYERIKAGISNSKHYVFYYCDNPVGVINVTAIDDFNGRCYWGFYLGDTSVPKGTGFAMGILGLQYIFEKINIRKLCSEVIASNVISLNYHLKLGFKQEGYFKQHLLRNGKYEDLICLALLSDEWMRNKPTLFQQCFGVDVL